MVFYAFYASLFYSYAFYGFLWFFEMYLFYRNKLNLFHSVQLNIAQFQTLNNLVIKSRNPIFKEGSIFHLACQLIIVKNFYG